MITITTPTPTSKDMFTVHTSYGKTVHGSPPTQDMFTVHTAYGKTVHSSRRSIGYVYCPYNIWQNSPQQLQQLNYPRDRLYDDNKSSWIVQKNDY